MALQPFVWAWPLCQFLDLLHSWQDALDGGSARRKASTYTQSNTNTEQTHEDIHASRGIRTHDPSVSAGKGGSCGATVIGDIIYAVVKSRLNTSKVNNQLL
jgi:hypothetical protein